MKNMKNMKKTLVLCCLIIGLVGVFTHYQLRRSLSTFAVERTTSRTARITNILDGHGDRLRSIAMQNTTSVNGAVTLYVNTLENPVVFRNYSGRIRWSTGDSRLELSNDDGTTWIQAGKPATLQTPIQFENYSGHFRWSTGDSRLEYSNDDGTTWETIGSGRGSEWAITGPGNGTTIASNTFGADTLDSVLFDPDSILASGAVSVTVIAQKDILDVAEHFVEWTQDWDAGKSGSGTATYLQFGVTTGNNLQLIISDCTADSDIWTFTSARNLTSIHTTKPVEYFAAYQNHTAIFGIDGKVGAKIAYSNFTTEDCDTHTSQHLKLGIDLDGKIYALMLGNQWLWKINTVHPPMREGTSYPDGTYMLDMDEQEGATLSNAFGNYSLIVDGSASWTESTHGY